MPEDFDRDELVKAWLTYGARFGAFSPFDQPVPGKWDPEIEEFDDKGRTNPKFLTHWKFMDQTKDFLRQRYGEHRILDSPSLIFDCLVPQYQGPVTYVKHDTPSGPDFFTAKEGPRWYSQAIEITVYGGVIGFSCRSRACLRDWCRLHRSQRREEPKRSGRVDVYGLLNVFERIPLVRAKTEVGKWFGLKLGDLKRAAGEEEKKHKRKKVSKEAVRQIILEFKDLRSHSVKELVRRLANLIRHSPLVDWNRRTFDPDYAFLAPKAATNLYRINSPAVKAYVWLLIKQEEAARNSRGPQFSVRDSELATGIHVTKRTACSYRKELMERGLVEVPDQPDPKTKETPVIRVTY